MREALKYLKENEEEAIKFIPKYDLNEIAKTMQKYTDQQFAIQRVSQQSELLIKCLVEWECSDEPEDIKAFKDWIDKRPHLINCG